MVLALVPDRTLIVNNADYRNGKWGHGPLNEASAHANGRYVGRRYAGKPIEWI